MQQSLARGDRAHAVRLYRRCEAELLAGLGIVPGEALWQLVAPLEPSR